MKRISLVLALTLSLGTLVASAHGNMDHIMGTVKRIAGNLITVEKDGASTDVALTATTTWETAGKTGKQEDLKVGDRVVIHALKVNGVETAHEVRFVHVGGNQ